MASWMILRRSIYPAATTTTRYFNWNCARGISSSSPWLLIEDSCEDVGNRFYNFYNIADKRVEKMAKDEISKDGRVVGSSHGWLALYKTRPDLNQSGDSSFDLFLYNPLSQRRINLPPFEIGRPRKVDLLGPPDRQNNCRVIMSFGPQDRLALCCTERSNKWTFIDDHFRETEPTPVNVGYTKDEPMNYKDFVYSTGQKKLFCITKFHKFECWDLRDTLSPVREWKIGNEALYSARQFSHIVFSELYKRLFVVQRHVMKDIGPNGGSFGYYAPAYGPYLTIRFDVFELLFYPDEKIQELRYMHATLDGMAFFIGSTGRGFVVEGIDHHQMEKMNLLPDSIYFTDLKELTPPPSVDKVIVPYGGHDLGIYNYEKKIFSQCYYPCNLQNIRRLEPTPTWFTPSH